LFNDSYLNVRVLTEFISAGETSGASADNNDVSISISDHVSHVASGHFTSNDGLLDGGEFEGVEIVGGVRGRHGNGEVLRGGFDGVEAKGGGGEGEGDSIEGIGLDGDGDGG
jgi:hypothetical protein